MNVENVRKAAVLMRQANDLLSQGPLDYYLTEMAAAHDLLMTRFAPFKVGDKVQLSSTIKLRPNSGWTSWAHLPRPVERDQRRRLLGRESVGLVRCVRGSEAGGTGLTMRKPLALLSGILEY